MINDKGMQHNPISNGKAVGEQGVSSKTVSGKRVANVNNPKGVGPKAHGSKAIPLNPQGHVSPVVGK